jgi:hypothetical protein
MGASWVAVNVALVALGAQFPYLATCSFVAGIIDGVILSIIVVATASARFQASATGLLGGLSLSALRHDGSMVWKFVVGLHEFLDKTLGQIFPGGSELLHKAVEQEILYILWTIIFVVMASLVTEWVRTARSEE